MCEDRFEFVRTSLPKDEVYDGWLQRIDKIEASTISTDRSRRSRALDSLNIGYELFPLIDAISFNLFSKNGRHYLKKLGYTDAEADMAFTVFRNGQLHSGNNYSLEYEDGNVHWAMSSSSGTGGFIPFDAGYRDETDPSFNLEAEHPIEYAEFPDSHFEISVSLDRLAAHIRHDLKERKSKDARKDIEVISGLKMQGKRRTPLKKISDNEAGNDSA